MGSNTGSRVKRLRLDQGLRQDELADLVRKYADGRPVAVETISRIETGKNEPAAWMIRALALALKTTADYLTDLTSVPDEPEASRYPIAVPEAAPLVARMNALTGEELERIVTVFDALLDLIEGEADVSEDPEMIQLVRLLDSFPGDRRAYWQREIEAEAKRLQSDPAASSAEDAGAGRRAIG